MPKIHPRQVNLIGADKGAVLVSVLPDACPGFTIVVDEHQPPQGDDGKGGGSRIRGTFKVISAGEGGYYTDGIKRVIERGQVFASANDFIDKLKQTGPDCERATHLLNVNALRVAGEE